jgi:integrase
MPLSFMSVNKAKPREKPYKMADERGLYLLISPGGGKYWRLNYRFAEKYRTMALGVFPDVGLADARARRDDARKLLANGVDPAVFRQEEIAKAEFDATTSFRVIAEEWLQKRPREGLGDITVAKAKWLLEFAYPALADRKISEITTPELLGVLREVEGRGRHETARRLRSVCGRVFRYAIATGRAEHDLAAGLRDALTTPKVKHLAAITNTQEVGPLLRAIEGFNGHAVTRLALRLAPHVFVRPGELRHAEWTEIDLDDAIWSIPAAKMKMRRPHKVPLSRQSIAIFQEVREITGTGQYVFPGFQSLRRPMSENALNGALRRLGYSGDEMTSHGFRAMASTLLNEMGRWHPDAIERQLAHVEGDGVRRAYARGEYWDERVQMMQHWSDHLDALANHTPNPRDGLNRPVQ